MLKVSISYPPMQNGKGVPALAQNRQFQYQSEESYIYPVVPASLATVASKQGYDVFWDDGIAEKLTYREWFKRIADKSPDAVFIETKTPTVKSHWRVINELKMELPETKIVLMGDHVTALPRESFLNSKVDYVMEGGEYDFKGLELLDFLSGKRDRMPSGFYLRNEDDVIYTGKSVENYDLDLLPFTDLELTKWKLYSELNGNYKFRPGTHTMFGRDCWYRKDGGCTFCSWTVIYPKFRVMSVERALDLVGHLIEDYGVREIFDDTGTFPPGDWLKKFTEGMVSRGYSGEVKVGCNMRVGVLSSEEYRQMKRAGFRFILYGIESANQRTLNMLNKSVRAEDQLPSIKKASDAGLDPHITVMFGYPWETKEEVMKTFRLGTEIIKKQYSKTWQVTIVIPYPGTALFDQAKKNGWLLTEDWDQYDMRRPIMSIPFPPRELMEIIEKFYGVAYTPEFIMRRIANIRTLDDVKFLFFGFKKVIGYRKNFSPAQVE
ncbi:MAG: B12-binding domain-containing radical SAM protein [Thermoplasmata archaeon]